MKWYFCPNCAGKLFKISDNAMARGIFYKCKHCKNVFEIKINSNKSR
jgi:predicted SprT family Zn-dependent metalloprotease